MALALHTIRPTRGSNGKAGEVPALSFMRRMSLCPGPSQGKARVTGKGPELGPPSGDESLMRASCWSETSQMMYNYRV